LTGFACLKWQVSARAVFRPRFKRAASFDHRERYIVVPATSAIPRREGHIATRVEVGIAEESHREIGDRAVLLTITPMPETEHTR